MQTLGELLKVGREGQGFTLRQVEEATGVSNAYLSQLENGKIKRPSANVLYKLAQIYKMTLDELLKASGMIVVKQPPEVVVVNNKALGPMLITDDEESQLLEYLRWLRFKKQQKFPIV